MRVASFSLLLILSFSGIAVGQKVVKTPSVIVPAGFKDMAEAKGDLDKDGIQELVVVFDTPKKTDMGTERQLWIYKQDGKSWKLWHKSTGAVLPSEHGGMMGDPFDGVEIEHGCIVVYHFGGSGQKWHYTHRYRYQNNNWYLIGVTINFGAPCDNLSNYDYNLSTGKIVATINTEKCNDTGDKVISSKSDNFTFVNKPAKPIVMDGFNVGDNEVKVPGGRESFYY